MLLFGAVVSLYLQAWRTGEFRAQSRPARWAMFGSLCLNAVYTGVVFYENYDASGALLFPLSLAVGPTSCRSNVR